MFERFSQPARRVIVLAQEESQLLGHDYIGSEHILLGLLHAEEGTAARALMTLGVALGPARAQLVPGEGAAKPGVPFTPRAKQVLENALVAALSTGEGEIGTEHLLLGVVAETDDVGARILAELGAEPDAVREAVREAAGKVGIEESAGSPRMPWLGRPAVWMARQPWPPLADPERWRGLASDVAALAEENDRLRLLLRAHGVDPEAAPGEPGKVP